MSVDPEPRYSRLCCCQEQQPPRAGGAVTSRSLFKKINKMDPRENITRPLLLPISVRLENQAPPIWRLTSSRLVASESLKKEKKTNLKHQCRQHRHCCLEVTFWPPLIALPNRDVCVWIHTNMVQRKQIMDSLSGLEENTVNSGYSASSGSCSSWSWEPDLQMSWIYWYAGISLFVCLFKTFFFCTYTMFSFLVPCCV